MGARAVRVFLCWIAEPPHRHALLDTCQRLFVIKTLQLIVELPFTEEDGSTNKEDDEDGEEDRGDDDGFGLEPNTTLWPTP